MKEYLLRRIDNDGKVIGDKAEGYSVYRNPDVKLKEEIASFKIDSGKVEMGWPAKEWTIIEWDGDEAKCQEGRNISYFKRTDLEMALSSKTEYERNQKFLAFKCFRQTFGIVSYHQKLDKKYGSSLTRMDLQEGILPFEFKKEIDPTTVEFYRTFYKYSLEISDYSDKGIELKVEQRGCSLKLYFNEDGDYVNRDYNENLNLYECKDISPETIYKDFEEVILDIGELKHSKGKYYSNEFMYIPYYNEDNSDLKLGISIIPKRSDGKSYQMYSGCTIYKKHSSLEESSSKALLEDLKGKMSDKFAESFYLKTEKVES